MLDPTRHHSGAQCACGAALQKSSNAADPELDCVDSKFDSAYAIYWIVNIFAVAIVALSAAGIFYARCIAGRP